MVFVFMGKNVLLLHKIFASFESFIKRAKMQCISICAICIVHCTFWCSSFVYILFIWEAVYEFNWMFCNICFHRKRNHNSQPLLVHASSSYRSKRNTTIFYLNRGKKIRNFFDERKRMPVLLSWYRFSWLLNGNACLPFHF